MEFRKYLNGSMPGRDTPINQFDIANEMEKLNNTLEGVISGKVDS